MAELPIAVTMGEPAGISAEITARAWAARGQYDLPPFFVIGDPDWAASGLAGLPVAEITAPRDCKAAFTQGLPVLPLNLHEPARPGTPSVANAAVTLQSIDRAVQLAQSGDVAAIVTNPIQKSVLYDAGFRHPGHTEYLAHLTGAKSPPTMLLSCPDEGDRPGLRVALVTVHLPLSQVPANLSETGIVATARAVAQALPRDFGVTEPRLAIAALNPHSGEAGALGREELSIIAPAIARLRAEGINAAGPLPADTLFHAAARRNHDCVICMYHDQALIPLKTIDFARGVNITLGLDIVRTSPDHGVALDIAGQGRADPQSLITALIAARDIARNRVAYDAR